MSTPAPEPRYGRRILGVGALAAFALFVVGAPIFVNSVEDDLERRVPDELASAGFDGLTVDFDGQDGVIGCEEPLDDPEAALAAAYEVSGVRSVELERSCRVRTTPDTSDGSDSTDDVSADPTDDESTTPEAADPSGSSTTSTTTTVPPDFATLADIINSDPQFSLLSVLTVDAGLDVVLGDPNAAEATMFAPTDAAFDALGADALAQVRSDPALLARVLQHHLVEGRLALADLSDGEITSLEGGALDVVVAGDGPVMIDDAVVVDGDIAAGNGMLHVIDAVLVPDDLDLSPTIQMAPVSAMLGAGEVVLEGVVASEVERAALIDAASPVTVVDRLEIDPDVGIDADTAAALAALVAVMATEFVSGESSFDGTELSLSGLAATESGRNTASDVAELVGAAFDVGVSPEPVDDEPVDVAADLEAELNTLVADSPILFESGSVLVLPESEEVIDRLAAMILEVPGVAITVEGHTDSDGVPAENVTLSRLRAIAVQLALIERGVSEQRLAAEGFGSEQPILVDGVEDKPASRRVQFAVVLVP